MADDLIARRARSFGAAATSYELGRPGYPATLIRWCLPSTARLVCDLGAGTGKLTRQLLSLGLEVIAVEPLGAMRALLPDCAHALAGTAEQIPLAASSVDAVLAAQAYHWFDPDRALPEIARVLRPGGALAAVWNVLDDRVAWVAEVADAVQAEDRLRRLSLLTESPFPRSSHFGLPEFLAVCHQQQTDIEGLLANVRSRSTLALLDPVARDLVVEKVRGVSPGGAFALPYVCVAWKIERK